MNVSTENSRPQPAGQETWQHHDSSSAGAGRPLLARIISPRTAGTDLLRLAICAILFTHGAYRLATGEYVGLGHLLHEDGFPDGVLLPILVCLAETAGTLLVALRLAVWPLIAVLSTIYITGIVLYHGPSGFFVVGPGENGWEYSALILVCLWVTAWENRNSKLY